MVQSEFLLHFIVAPAEAWLCADEDDYDAFLMTSSRSGPEPPPPYSEIAQEGHISVSHAAPAEHRLGQSFNTSEVDILNQSMRSTVSLPLNIHDRVAALELLLQGERTRANNVAIEAAAPPARVVPHSLSLPPSLQRPSTQPLLPLPPCPPLLRRSSSRHSCHSELPPISLQHLSHSQHYRVQRRTRRKVKNRRRSQGISQSLRDDVDGQLTIRLSTNVSREGGRIAETVDGRVEEIRDEVVDQASCSDAIVEDRTTSTSITQQSCSDHNDEEQWPELEGEEERERQEEERKERDENNQSFNQLVTEQREEEDRPSDIETNNSNNDQSSRTDSSDQEEEEESKL